MKEVVVVIGPGQIGQAIVRRVSFGKHVLLADYRQENAEAAAKVLGDAGYDVTVATVDASSRQDVHKLVETAKGLGKITGLVHAAGVSPSQAPIAAILKVDLYGTALVLEEFGNVIEPGGSGVVIASQSGHRLPPLSVEQNKALATTPVEELLGLPTSLGTSKAGSFSRRLVIPNWSMMVSGAGTPLNFWLTRPRDATCRRDRLQQKLQ